MFDAIHVLSRGYGWSKKEILETIYPDEVSYYISRINKQQASEQLGLLALIHNPHVKNPEKLVQELQSAMNTDEGKYYEKDRMNVQDMQKMGEIKRLMAQNAQARKS